MVGGASSYVGLQWVEEGSIEWGMPFKSKEYKVSIIIYLANFIRDNKTCECNDIFHFSLFSLNVKIKTFLGMTIKITVIKITKNK